MATFDIATAQSRFPALQQNEQVFLDNAGGSQALDTVIDSLTTYLSSTNVQLGASYKVGRISTASYAAGYEAAAKYINASPDEIVLASSTTQNFMNLAGALQIPAGSEVILSMLEHETNVKPWLHMADRLNLAVKWWGPVAGAKGDDLKHTPESLKPLLSEKTRFVACTHVSNILGTIHDVRAIADVVHANGSGALFCVDGVSFAPHRQVDVKAFGVDCYAFSWYKVYGPHLSVLYVSESSQEHLKSQNHYFNPSKTLQDKIGFAGSNYEATQSIPRIVEYLGGDNPAPVFQAIATHESNIQAILLNFLNSRPDITVHGSTTADSTVRVPTISFTVAGRSSREIVEEADKTVYGFRWGHFYSKRLCEEILGLGEEAVVRVSMVHYNTEEEIRGLVEALNRILG